MNSHAKQHSSAQSWLSRVIDEACQVIAPNWPLDKQIAVNPWWGLIDRPFRQVSLEMRQLLGMNMSGTLADYRRAVARGDIPAPALYRAHAEWHEQLQFDDVMLALAPRPESVTSTGPAQSGLPLLSDSLDLDGVRPGDAAWRDLITQQISQFCASYFDDLQADWQRGQHRGLWLTWRESLLNDPAVTSHSQHRQLQQRWQAMPTTPVPAIEWALNHLQMSVEHVPALLRLCLLRINGWASWCAYLQWQSALQPPASPRAAPAAHPQLDTPLTELLAIRLAWEALLIDEAVATQESKRHAATASVSLAVSVGPWSRWQARWQEVWQSITAPRTPAHELLTIAQRAQEVAYQDQLIRAFNERSKSRSRTEQHIVVPLTNNATHADSVVPNIQLVFCIDVRSERLRRALEAIDPSLATRGFAGFFGLPIAYAPLGTQHARPQLPGLVAPAVTVTESTGDATADERLAQLRYRSLTRVHAQRPFARSASGAFTMVESLGLTYAASLLRRHFAWGNPQQTQTQLGLCAQSSDHKPTWPTFNNEQIDGLAEMLVGILRGMGLTRHLPRLLVLIGHGSHSANNPQAAALECGACGGHAGDVNARVLAALLNHPPLRQAISARGIELPESWWVMAGLHHTITDEVTLFDLQQVPVTHQAAVTQLQSQLQQAGEQVRAERAPDLQLGELVGKPKKLLKALQQRGRDWAQTRPEWGLANNAAFVIAPRSRTRGMNLDGRSFLHDYQWSEDLQGKVLEQIMTAPMVVTHWINMQYFASTVEPLRYGSGNKLLHNVVGSGLGLFEGNSGDLRIGLAKQSVHDGQRFMHTPLRLSVFVDAPRAMIDDILKKHSTVNNLVVNQWLHLFRFSERGIEHYQHGWQLWDKSASLKEQSC